MAWDGVPAKYEDPDTQIVRLSFSYLVVWFSFISKLRGLRLRHVL